MPSIKDRMPHRRAAERKPADTEAERKGLFLHDIINSWWERLFSVIFGGSWDDQPHMYRSGQRAQDYLLNTLGSVAWGIWDWGNLPSLVEATTAFAIVLLGGWAVILIRWWTDYAWDD